MRDAGNIHGFTVFKRLFVFDVRIGFFHNRIRHIIHMAYFFEAISGLRMVLGKNHVVVVAFSIPEKREKERIEKEKRKQKAAWEKGMTERTERGTETVTKKRALHDITSNLKYGYLPLYYVGIGTEVTECPMFLLTAADPVPFFYMYMPIENAI